MRQNAVARKYPARTGRKQSSEIWSTSFHKLVNIQFARWYRARYNCEPPAFFK